MKKVFPVYILLMIGLLFVVGCGGDEEPLPPEPVGIDHVDPPSNSEIKSDATITVIFDGVPAKVKVNLETVTLAGQAVTRTLAGQAVMITELFEEGALKIEITWEGGSHVLEYTVKAPEPPNPQENMVTITAGEFQRSDDPDAGDDEQSLPKVYVDAFSMDQYEVTNDQYRQFVLANPSWAKDKINSNLHDGNYLKHWDGNKYPENSENHPVVYVSWYAAVAYARWAEKRLPTGAEWEYAARGGLSDKKYPWGDVVDINKANYDGNIGKTTPKGKYPPNKYDLYDMGGNVWEWCLDEYNEDFYSSPPPKNPLSGANSPDWIMNNFESITTDRVARGGSWANSPEYLRVALSASFDPRNANCLTGFRCVKK